MHKKNANMFFHLYEKKEAKFDSTFRRAISRKYTVWSPGNDLYRVSGKKLEYCE